MNDDLSKIAEAEARRNAKLGQLNLVFGGFILAGLLAAGLAGGWCHAANTTIWAFACLAVGAFIGLLFGIPRVKQGVARDIDSKNPAADVSYAEINNNLVEVSDWLTKIIVGVGLVQLTSLPDRLKQIAGPLARCLDGKCGMAVAVGVIMFFSFAGFLAGYINARTFIAAMLVESDGTLMQQFRDRLRALQALPDIMEDRAGTTGLPLPGKSMKSRPADPSGSRNPSEPSPPTHELASSIDTPPSDSGGVTPETLVPQSGPSLSELGSALADSATPSAPQESGKRGATPDLGYDPDDPHRDQFGGAPENNGRVIEAIIEPAHDRRGSACWVHLQVRSTNPLRPLTGKVTLFLHPTFGRHKKYDVNVEKGIAKDTILSWGAFTVGAIADSGGTKLELNLANVPGGTTTFYES